MQARLSSTYPGHRYGLCMLESDQAAGGLSVSAGGQLVVGPRLPGSGNNSAIAVPNIQARYKDFLPINPINPTDGIGVVYGVDDKLRLGASLGVDLTKRLNKDNAPDSSRTRSTTQTTLVTGVNYAF